MKKAAKPTVEQSFVLSIEELHRSGALVEGYQGVYRQCSNALRFSIEYSAVVLRYQLTGVAYLQRIRIGLVDLSCWSRVCFLCPACSKPVYKLYLAPRSAYFGCRTCSNLCYTSQKLHYGSNAYEYWRLRH